MLRKKVCSFYVVVTFLIVAVVNLYLMAVAVTWVPKSDGSFDPLGQGNRCHQAAENQKEA